MRMVKPRARFVEVLDPFNGSQPGRLAGERYRNTDYSQLRDATAGAAMDEIRLICDGDGLAVIGSPADVERFLHAENLSSKDLGLQRLTSVVGTGASVVQAGSEIAANSGRWVKLTRESADLVRRYGLRDSSSSGLSTGVIKGNKGQIKAFVEFVKRPRSLVTNPSILAGAAGLMTQLAMQHAMDEITEYLAAIDVKLDDVLRAQKDAVLARMIGVGLVLEEAMTIRAVSGKVGEVTWSKVQVTPATIAETQAYALRQIDALAEKMERTANIGDLATTTREAEATACEWLAVLARCVQLQDAIAVLELDRVMDAVPEELDRHRLGLQAARHNRLEHISWTVERLVDRMNVAATRANAKVLLHPGKSPAVVQSSNHIVAAVDDLRGRLGIESSRQSQEVRLWTDAAAEARDRALETGAKGVDAARNLGSETLERARTVTGKISSGIAERTRRPSGDEEQRVEQG